MDDFSTPNTGQDWFDSELESNVKGSDKSPKTDSILQRCCPDSEDSNLGTFHKLRNASKPHSTPLTLKWLEGNYEIAEGVCIPRSTLYYHYLDYCEKNDTQPVNAASFGKIIRQQFPQITTRRLGTRGQSKYHYYGIGVKEESIYYEVMYSAKGVQTSGDGKKESAKQIVAYSPRSKLGTLLPDFPEVKDIKLPGDIPEDKVTTFMMMYRTHCQRILDTVIRANFDEVQSFLLHFWQGMPQHMVPILDSQTIVMLVGVCDSILYKAIANVLMPTVLQALPDSLTQVIRRFARQLDDWLKIALDSLPEGLQRIKFDLARRFAQVLRRQTSLNHLCQAARSVVHSPDITSQMLDDWLNVDLNSIVKQTLYTMDDYSDRDNEIIVNLSNEFERLLEDQAPLESYVEWLESMVDKCVVKPSAKTPGSLRRTARQFLLMWSCFGTRVIRDMTLHSAQSFGSFHLMHLMFDDYVLYLVESLHSQERANDYLRYIKGEDQSDLCEDIILPDSSVIKEAFIAAVGDTHFESSEKQNERGSVITRARENGDATASPESYVPTGSTAQNSNLNESGRFPNDVIGPPLTYSIPMSGDTSSQCSAFVSPITYSTSHMQGSEHSVFQNNCNRNQNQFPLSALYVSTNSGSEAVGSVVVPEMQRFGGAIPDWNPHFSQDFGSFPRMWDDNSVYQQLSGIRQTTFDFNSMGYFDNVNPGRGYVTGNEMNFPQSTSDVSISSNVQSEKRQRLG